MSQDADQAIRGLDEDTGIPKLTILGQWKRGYADLVETEGYLCLSLNTSLGFTEPNLSFLRQVPSLKKLEFVGVSDDDGGVENCHALEHLSLDSSSPRKIDYSNFPELRSVFLYGLGKSDSILQCSQLEDLYVYGFPDGDCQRLTALDRLTSVRLGPAKKLASLDGLESCTRLTRLGIYNAPKLADARAVERLRELKRLEFESCKRLGNVEFAQSLSELEVLHIADCGPIDSLIPLRSCQRLTSLIAWESTNIVDGNLSALGDLPRLNTVAMMRRRHYRGIPVELEGQFPGTAR